MSVSKKTRQILDETSAEFSLALSRLADGGRMKERWPEMLEYQQKVQAMTRDSCADLKADIDRLLESLRLAEEEIDELRDRLADARREGAEEMRERAAQLAFDRTSDDPQPGDWNEACEHVADAIRALPLTPEEPT